MSRTQLKKASLKSGATVFYREAAPNSTAPVILLLHGFPSSSHQYRNMIPLLASHYRVIAPDLPGFGFTEVPNDFEYSFQSLTTVIADLLDDLSLSKYSMYIFDYGAPVGLRLALQRPDAIQAIITQNGNAYVEGFGNIWGPIKELWASGGAEANRKQITEGVLSLKATRAQYEDGTPDLSLIAPETYTLDYALMERPGNKKIQVDLFLDYQNNVALYDKFHEYFRKSHVPLLAIWGKNDLHFIPPGAEAFRRDLPDAEIKFLDAGHFAAESHTEEIAGEMLKFLRKQSL